MFKLFYFQAWLTGYPSHADL